MEGNRSKPAEMRQSHLSAVRLLGDWLQQEGGNQRIPQVLMLLARSTELELSDGRDPPSAEVETLALQYVDVHGGTLGDTPAGRWLRRSEVEKWWNARAPAIEQACRRAGMEWLPLLAIKIGGGRSNSTEYRIGFMPLEEAEEPETLERDAVVEEGPDPGHTIHYQIEPARASLWVKWLSTMPQFQLSSWRGRLLTGLVLLALAWVAVNWLVAFLGLWPDRPFSSRNLLTLAIAATQTWLVWVVFGPLGRLPWHRVTLAPDMMLSTNQMYGQFRLIRNAKKKAPGGWFSLVRHWGACPICSADVDLRDGAKTFPGRLVGRCSDSPLEHVFSFDPVTLVGTSLIKDRPSQGTRSGNQ
jgi:hypothetical protein